MERIEAFQIPNLTVEQMIPADSAVDSRFHYSQGIWWREVKPLFYQPAAMFQSVARGSSLPKRFLALGGYYHVVPSWSMANGQIVSSQVADIGRYDLSRLSKQARYEIRRGLTKLRIDRVTSLDDLLGDGYSIYLKWEKRIKNAWVKRSDPKVFKKWIAGVLGHPGNLVLGAYDYDRLVAYVIVRGVEGVAELAKSFTDPEYYPISPSSALFIPTSRSAVILHKFALYAEVCEVQIKRWSPISINLVSSMSAIPRIYTFALSFARLCDALCLNNTAD